MHTVHLSTGEAGLRHGHPSLWLDDKLHEAACQWLNERAVPRSASQNTWAQAARAVASWLDFLEAWDTEWRHASREELIAYRDTFLAGISPRTGKHYSTQTVRTRMVYIVDFMQHAVSQGWTDQSLSDAWQLTAKLSSQEGSTNATQARKSEAKRAALGDRKLLPKTTHDETVRVLRKEELRTLLRWAGPRPTFRQKTDGGSDRDNIVFALAWAVGLRVEEVTRLTVYPFETMVPDHKHPGEMFQISVKGKGNNTRTVDVPSWLVSDVQAYVGGQRNYCLRQRGPRVHESQLILNSENSRNRVGRPISRNGIQALIRRACEGAALMRRIERINPETGKIAVVAVPRYSFHCLRHTYAVMTYHHHKNSGLDETEVWKYIQSQLGHRSARTTMDIYLRHVSAWSSRRTSTSLLDALNS